MDLQGAKKELWEKMKGKGGDCPCCGRFAKVYKRPLNKTQVRALYWMMQSRSSWDKNGYMEIAGKAPVWILNSNQHTILKHWGFVEPKPHPSGKKKDSGWWRITNSGLDFLNGKPVNKYVFLFNDRVLGTDGPEVTFADIFDLFDYEQLMRDRVQ